MSTNTNTILVTSFKDKMEEMKDCQVTGTLGVAMRYCEGVYL
jgi:hypothetical protein